MSISNEYAVETRNDNMKGFWLRAPFKCRGLGAVRLVTIDLDDLELENDSDALFQHEFTENHDLIIFVDEFDFESLVVTSRIVEM